MLRACRAWFCSPIGSSSSPTASSAAMFGGWQGLCCGWRRNPMFSARAPAARRSRLCPADCESNASSRTEPISRSSTLREVRPARMSMEPCSRKLFPARPKVPRSSMKHVLVALLLNLLAVGPSYAQAKGQSLFDVEARRAALAQPTLTNVRAACLAIPRDPAWAGLKPIEGLKATEGYGTDGAANDYAWA